MRPSPAALRNCEWSVQSRHDAEIRSLLCLNNCIQRRARTLSHASTRRLVADCAADHVQASRHIQQDLSPNMASPSSNLGSTSPAPEENPFSRSNAGDTAANPETHGHRGRMGTGDAPPPHSQEPQAAQSTTFPGGGASKLSQGVQLFPAEVTVVNSPAELQAAIADGKRDIEIHSHLDLRNLPLKHNPNTRASPFSRGPDRKVINTDLAFLSWPTRSIRVRHRDHHTHILMHISTLYI